VAPAGGSSNGEGRNSSEFPYLEAVSHKNLDFVSSKDSRFRIERAYRSDRSDILYRGASGHGGSWGAVFDEVIDNRLSSYPSYHGRDLVYFSEDGSRRLFNYYKNGNNHLNFRNGDPTVIQASGWNRILTDGSGTVVTFTPYNLPNDPGYYGFVSYSSNYTWPDGYTITVTRQAAGNPTLDEPLIQAIEDNRGQRAVYTWQRLTTGSKSKDVISG